LRAITRKVDSPAAQKLKAQGVEVVQADYYDVESTKKAFEGAYGVFAVTQFWERFNPEEEVKQGKNMADAAKAGGVKHFVYSTLEHSYVTHFDSKAQVTDYIKSINLPATNVYSAFYFENLQSLFPPQKDADGTIVVDIPIISDAKIFAFAVEDIGGFVAEAFRNPGKWIGKDMQATAEFISVKEMVDRINEVSTTKARYVEYTTVEEMRTTKSNGQPVYEDLFLNMKYFYENQSGVRDPEFSRSIYPELQDFVTYIKRHPFA